MEKIYLDNAATSKPAKETLSAAERFVRLFTNENKSASDITREMRGYLTDARKRSAEFIHADPDEIALVISTTAPSRAMKGVVRLLSSICRQFLIGLARLDRGSSRESVSTLLK